MKAVNYITHLNGVLRKFSGDSKISAAHRSLYLAFFELWNQKHFPKTLMVNSKQVMALAKIRSRTTYHKLLQNLKILGYIEYKPSHVPQIGSIIEMFRFDTLTDQKMNKSYPFFEQVPVQKMAPFNKVNNKQNLNSIKQTSPENEKVVLEFFKKENRSLLEAKRFYNFYEAIGWKMGGKNPITNWQACALSWILKAEEIKNEKKQRGMFQNRDNLHTSKYKDYGEPL